MLATGIGKIWTAAFDSALCVRILLVARREEVLTQAMIAFRSIRREARLNRFDGGTNDDKADIC